MDLGSKKKGKPASTGNGGILLFLEVLPGHRFIRFLGRGEGNCPLISVKQKAARGCYLAEWNVGIQSGRTYDLETSRKEGEGIDL